MTRILRRTGALFVAVLTALLLGAGLASTATAAPPSQQAVPVPISSVPGTDPAFNGTLNIERFTAHNGQLAAVGTLVGTLTPINGTPTAIEPTTVTVPVDLAQTAASCQILDLVLGPLNLDLLGLVVHLDTVHLNITAQSAPGNLLGNLLCSVAHLLDGPASLNAIAALLNRLLGILG